MSNSWSLVPVDFTAQEGRFNELERVNKHIEGLLVPIATPFILMTLNAEVGGCRLSPA